MECFGVPGLSLNCSIQTKKGEVSVGSLRVLSKGHTGEGIGRQGRLFITKCPGEDNKELALTCDLLGCYIKHELQGGADVSSRPLQAAWPHKMGAEAAV